MFPFKPTSLKTVWTRSVTAALVITMISVVTIARTNAKDTPSDTVEIPAPTKEGDAKHAPVYSQKDLNKMIPIADTDVSAESMSSEERQLQRELLADAPEVKKSSIEETPHLAWSSAGHPERELWSRYLTDAVSEDFDDLDQAKDITRFCPKYRSLTKDQRIVAWAQLFTGIAFWESSFTPTAHALERFADKGTDDVTGLPVYSEGLLQLSYQDVDQDGMEDFCRFDWPADKKLAEDDIHRTIFNPYNNLYCGVHLMSSTVKANDNKIIVKENYYWSTLQAGNIGENRVDQISEMVQRLPYCGKTFHNPIINGILTFYRKIQHIH